MINANELRIGNWVNNPLGKGHNEPGIAQVKTLGYGGINEWQDMGASGNIPYKDLEPIPLTAEWIERFGGKKLRGVPFYEIDMNRNIGQIHINPGNGMIFLRHHRNPQTSLNPMSDNTYYVHQIQNLYFALTGEELTIKETV